MFYYAIHSDLMMKWYLYVRLKKIRVPNRSLLENSDLGSMNTSDPFLHGVGTNSALFTRHRNYADKNLQPLAIEQLPTCCAHNLLPHNNMVMPQAATAINPGSASCM